jgi:general secretion pathway protein G
MRRAFVLSLLLLSACCLEVTPAMLEKVLRLDLRMLRTSIEQFRRDRARCPESLQELVASGHLTRVPVDPMTKSAETWMVVTGAGACRGRVVDVHSGSGAHGLDGRPYSAW